MANGQGTISDLQLIPQVSPWLAGADALRQTLLDREARKQKALLDSLAVQGKQAEIADKMAGTEKTQAETAQIGPNAQSARDVQAANVKHANALASGEEARTQNDAADRASLEKLTNAYLQAPEGSDDQTKAGRALMMAHGQSVAGVDAITRQQHMQDLIKAGQDYDAALASKDPTRIQQAGTRFRALGVSLPQPEEKFGTVPQGGTVFDKTTGKATFTAPTAASQVPDLPDEVIQEAAKQVRDGVSLPAWLTAKMSPGDQQKLKTLTLAKTATGESPNLAKVTTQEAARRAIAEPTVESVDHVEELADQLQKMNLFGTVQGRWRDLVTSESLPADLANLTPEQKQTIGQFQTAVKLMTSAAINAHAGARGAGSPQLADQMKPAFDPGAKDFDTYLGNLREIRRVLTKYARSRSEQDEAAAKTQGGSTGKDLKSFLESLAPKKGGG